MKREHIALLLSGGVSVALWMIARSRPQALGLEEYDAEQRRWKVVTPKQPTAAATQQRRYAWSLHEGNSVTIEPGRLYAGVVQLSGLEATFGDSDDVRKGLLAAVQKAGGGRSEAFKMDVYGEAAAVPTWFPAGSLQDQSGRFWLLMVPDFRAQFERPEPLVRLWSSPYP